MNVLSCIQIYFLSIWKLALTWIFCFSKIYFSPLKIYTVFVFCFFLLWCYLTYLLSSHFHQAVASAKFWWDMKKILVFIPFCVGVVSRWMCDACSSLLCTPESLISLWPTINVNSLDMFRPQSGTSGSSHNKANALWLLPSALSNTHTHTQRYRPWIKWHAFTPLKVMMLLKALPAEPCCFIIHTECLLLSGWWKKDWGVSFFLFEVNVFWRTVLSFPRFNSLFSPPSIYLLMSHFPSKFTSFKRPMAPSLLFNSGAKVKYHCIWSVSAYLGGVEENNNFQNFEHYE